MINNENKNGKIKEMLSFIKKMLSFIDLNICAFAFFSSPFVF